MRRIKEVAKKEKRRKDQEEAGSEGGRRWREKMVRGKYISVSYSFSFY